MKDITMDETPDGFLGWVMTGVATVIAALSSVVAYLYRGQITEYEGRLKRGDERLKAVELKAEECEKDRSSIRVELAKHQGRLQVLEKRVNGNS